MIINLLKEKLGEVINVVTNICPSRTDLGILNYFYIEAKDNEVGILATDLELNYQTRFPARVLEEGKALIPAKQFEKIIDNFYEEEITLETKGNTLIIKGERSFSSLPGLSEEEFPTFSTIDEKNYFEIDNDLFENYIQKLFPVLVTSDIRPEYAGIYFDLQKNNLNLVVTDTIRLGVQKVKNQFYETNIYETSRLLPKRLIEEYARIKRKSGKVKIYFEENQATLEVLNHRLTSRIPLVEYPRYTDFISIPGFIFSFLIDKDLILKALKLSRVFSSQFKEIELIFNFDGKKLYLYTQNELLGENKNELDFEIQENSLNEKEFKIKFHLDFLYDGFNSFETEKVFAGFFSGSTESTPIYLKSPLDDDFVYILIHR